MNEVPVTLFGLLQTVHGGRVLHLEVPPGASVATAQQLVLEQLRLEGQAVALATPERVLKPEELLPLGVEILALPPVCGG